MRSRTFVRAGVVHAYVSNRDFVRTFLSVRELADAGARAHASVDAGASAHVRVECVRKCVSSCARV